MKKPRKLHDFITITNVRPKLVVLKTSQENICDGICFSKSADLLCAKMDSITGFFLKEFLEL